MACTECKHRNYITKKNRRNDPDRIELKKFCPQLPQAHRAPRDPLTSRRRGRSHGSGLVVMMCSDRTLSGGRWAPIRGRRADGRQPCHRRAGVPAGAPSTRWAARRSREFAAAIGSDDPAHLDPAAARALGHPDVIAPPTFAVIVALRAEAAVVRDPEAGIDFSRVVHGEERFTRHRPDRRGRPPHRDAVRRQCSRSGRPRHGDTRVEIADRVGEPVSHRLSPRWSSAEVRDGPAPPSTPSPSGTRCPPARSRSPGRPRPLRGRERRLQRHPLERADRARPSACPTSSRTGCSRWPTAARLVTDWAGDPGAVVEYGVRFTKPVAVPDDDGGAELEVAGVVAGEGRRERAP